MEIALLANGTIDDSFIHGGIHPSTGYKWLAKGRKAAKGEYREFFEHVERWRSQAKVSNLTTVTLGAKADPRLALEILARRFPNEWARTHRVDFNDKTTASGRRENIRERVTAKLDQIEARLSGNSSPSRPDGDTTPPAPPVKQ